MLESFSKKPSDDKRPLYLRKRLFKLLNFFPSQAPRGIVLATAGYDVNKTMLQSEKLTT